MLARCRHTELVGANIVWNGRFVEIDQRREKEFIMSKRFMLTAAGIAATGIAGTNASAELVNMTHSLDRWAGEHSWQVYSSGGSIVASMYAAGSLFYAGVSSLSYVSDSASSIFGTITGTMDLASGTYNVQMQDSYGDGWAWGSFVGGLAIGSGSASLPSGSSGSFNFTVAGIPAPGALALLGLAGLTARRRK